MRIKERLLAQALSALMTERGVEVVLRDEAGTFRFRMDAEKNALALDQLDPDDPLIKSPWDNTLIVTTRRDEKTSVH